MLGGSGFLTAVAYVLVAAGVASAVVVLRGADKWSRLLGYSLTSGKVNLLIVVIAMATGNRFYLDIALVYLVLSYIGIIVLTDYMVNLTDPGS